MNLLYLIVITFTPQCKNKSCMKVMIKVGPTTVLYITAYSLTHKNAILDPVNFSDDVCAIRSTMLIYI